MARVLIVEDEPSVAMVVREALRDEGHEVEAAADGVQGLRRLALPPPPDLVLLDLFMPGLGGRAVVEHMRSHPDLAGIPVILITGAVPRVCDFPPEGSYQGVLGKPFDLNDLLAIVERFGPASPQAGGAASAGGGYGTTGSVPDAGLDAPR